MFTLQQINTIHDRLGKAETFAAYVIALKDIGVERYDSFLADGHSEYYDQASNVLVSPAVHDVLTIADASSKQALVKHLDLHEQGKTNYLEMSEGLAAAGIEKWTVDTETSTMVFYDKANRELLIEPIA